MSASSGEEAGAASGEGRAKASGSSSAHSQSSSSMHKEGSFAWSQANEGEAGSIGSDAAYHSSGLPSLGCWNEDGRYVIEEEAKEIEENLDDDADVDSLHERLQATSLEEDEEQEAAATHAAIPPTPSCMQLPAMPSQNARRLQRSVASSTEGSEELFSFKMREKVAQTEADERRSPSPTLFLCRPSKSYSEMKAGEAERLSSMSRPSHCFSDLGPSESQRASLNEQSSSSSSNNNWRDSLLMLRQPHSVSQPGCSSSSSIQTPDPNTDPQPCSPAGSPVSITRICSESFAQRPPPPLSFWSRSSSSVGQQETLMLQPEHTQALFQRPQQPDNGEEEAHNLDDAQLRAHAVVFARAKSISVEEACAQLQVKCARARRKNSLPLDGERILGADAPVVDRRERRSS